MLKRLGTVVALDMCHQENANIVELLTKIKAIKTFQYELPLPNSTSRFSNTSTIFEEDIARPSSWMSLNSLVKPTFLNMPTWKRKGPLHATSFFKENFGLNSNFSTSFFEGVKICIRLRMDEHTNIKVISNYDLRASTIGLSRLRSKKSNAEIPLWKF
jgi:hypothetical protein